MILNYIFKKFHPQRIVYENIFTYPCTQTISSKHIILSRGYATVNLNDLYEFSDIRRLQIDWQINQRHKYFSILLGSANNRKTMFCFSAILRPQLNFRLETRASSTFWMIKLWLSCTIGNSFAICSSLWFFFIYIYIYIYIFFC